MMLPPAPTSLGVRATPVPPPPVYKRRGQASTRPSVLRLMQSPASPCLVCAATELRRAERRRLLLDSTHGSTAGACGLLHGLRRDEPHARSLSLDSEDHWSVAAAGGWAGHHCLPPVLKFQPPPSVPSVVRTPLNRLTFLWTFTRLMVKVYDLYRV
jgi:hypothetical protein